MEVITNHLLSLNKLLTPKLKKQLPKMGSMNDIIARVDNGSINLEVKGNKINIKTPKIM